MKRFLHALAALWPKRKEVGKPPATPTSTGLRQHLAAVLRIEGYLSECTDIHSRKRNAVPSPNVKRSGLTANRPERSDVPHPSRKAGSEAVGIDDCNAVTPGTRPAWREVKRSGSPNQPNNLPRIPQPMPLLTILMLVFFMCLMAAPSRAIGTAAFLDSIPESAIRPLQIGDTIPEELWHLPLQVVNHPEGKETITLNDYRGKLIILDFWGTFCGSCIAAMPKISEVQQQFAEDMVVAPVSWSKPDATEQALQTHRTLAPLGLSSVVNAKTLIDAFPHGVVPHYAWIDRQGRVVATTATNDVTHDNISAVLKGEEPDYALKTFIDPDKPLLFAGEKLPDGVEVQQYSVFIRGAMPSLGGGTSTRTKDGVAHGYIMQNRSIMNMYQIIASKIKGDSIPIMGKVGYKRFHIYDDVADDAKCTFDFILPPQKADSLYQFMLASLNQHSGYHGAWVVRKQPCLVLSKTGLAGKLVNNSQEKYFLVDSTVCKLAKQSINRLIKRLNWEDISSERIVINETGYDGDIDITFHAPFDDFANIRRQLNVYGLDLAEAEREVEVFELRKNTYQ